MSDAQQREREARKTLMDAVDLDTTDCPHCVAGIAALDTYRAAVRAALVEEIVAKVAQGAVYGIKQRRRSDGASVVEITHIHKDKAMDAKVVWLPDVIATIRGLAAPTTEEG